jgi:hypothetical protein
VDSGFRTPKSIVQKRMITVKEARSVDNLWHSQMEKHYLLEVILHDGTATMRHQNTFFDIICAPFMSL